MDLQFYIGQANQIHTLSGHPPKLARCKYGLAGFLPKLG